MDNLRDFPQIQPQQHEQQRPVGSTSAQFSLFAFDEELRNTRKRNHIRFAQAKIALTDKLICQTMANVIDCSEEQFQCMEQVLIYSRILTKQHQAMRRLEQQGVINPSPERVMAQNSFDDPFDPNFGYY